METYRRLLLLGARTLSVLALVILVLIKIWTILTNGAQWIGSFHAVTIFTQGPVTVSPSTPTVEPEAVSFHHRTIARRLVALDVGRPHLIRALDEEFRFPVGGVLPLIAPFSYLTHGRKQPVHGPF